MGECVSCVQIVNIVIKMSVYSRKKKSVYVCFCRAAPLISTIPTVTFEVSEPWRENGQMDMLVSLFTHALVQNQ